MALEAGMGSGLKSNQQFFAYNRGQKRQIRNLEQFHSYRYVEICTT